MSSEEQRLESKILYFEDMMFRYKGYEYQKVETIRKEISDMGCVLPIQVGGIKRG